MFTSQRAKRVIEAFIHCVEYNGMTYENAVIAMENEQKYPYLTEEDKESFYSSFNVSSGEIDVNDTDTIDASDTD